MTKIQPTTPAGGRQPSEATREKLRAAGQKAWTDLTEEQRAARLANLTKGRAPRSTPPVPAPSTDPPPAPATGAPVNPLDDAPRALPRDRPRAQGRLNGHSAPPIFRVPDLPPLELGDPGLGGGPPLDELDASTGGGIQVTQAQVESLLGFPFELVAIRRGAHWKLRNDERDMVAEPLTRKINEHALAARAIGAGGDWAIIIGGLAILVSARIAEDSANAGARGGAAAGAGDGSGQGGRAPAPDDRDRDGPDRPGDGGRGGSLNGFSVGAAANGSPQAVPPEAPQRSLSQTL